VARAASAARAGRGGGDASASASAIALPARPRAIAAYLVVDKLAGGGVAAWPLHYEPGQYVYLSLRPAGWLPHPLSVSSAPDERAPGRLTVHVRAGAHAGSWSSRLVAAVEAAVVATARETAAAANDEAEEAGAGSDADADPDGAGPCAVAGGAAALPPPSATVAFASGAARRLQRLRELLPVRVAGAFGAPSVQLARYSHFLLLAGGVGITPVAPLHFELCRGGHSLGASCRMRSLLTAWSLRDAGLLAAFAPQLRAFARARSDNGGSGDGGDGGDGGDESDGSDNAVVGHAEVFFTRDSPEAAAAAAAFPGRTLFGRPDVAALCDRAAAAAAKADAKAPSGGDDGASGGGTRAIAVVVCGPRELVASVLEAAGREWRGYALHVHAETFNL
jgi:hypothetical protein